MALPGTFCIGVRVRGGKDVAAGTASIFLVNGRLVGVTAKHIFLLLADGSGNELPEVVFEILTGKLVIRSFDPVTGVAVRAFEPIPREGNVIATTTCALFEELDVAFFKLNQDIAIQAGFDWEGSPLWVDFDITLAKVGEILGMEDLDTGAYSTQPCYPHQKIMKYGAASGTTQGMIFGFAARKVVVENDGEPFAMQGDSGGLAFEKDSGLALGVVTGLSLTPLNQIVPTWAISRALYMMVAPKVRSKTFKFFEVVAEIFNLKMG